MSESKTFRIPRPRKRSLSLNESAFDGAEKNPEACYWIGMLLADGNLSDPAEGSPVVKLSLSGEDGAHVWALQRFLGSGSRPKIFPARRRPGRGDEQEATVLAVRSWRLAVALADYGVAPRKSLTATPHPCLTASRDFWRGVVDGDGWVSVIGRPTGQDLDAEVGIVGSFETVRPFAAFCASCYPTEAGPRRCGSIWRCRVRGRAAFEVVSLLYKGCTVALPRKHSTALRIFSLFHPDSWERRRTFSSITAEQLADLKRQLVTWRAVAASLDLDPAQLWRIRRRLAV
jgi:hypothetical protein